MLVWLFLAVVTYEALELVDRLVATQAPAAAPFRAWYSTDAAHRILLRPRFARLSVQTFLIAALFIAWMAHPVVEVPLVVGATRLLVSVLHGYVWPSLLKAPTGVERTLGNRLLPLEQEPLQEMAEQRIDWNDACCSNHPRTKAFPEGQVDAGDGTLPPDVYRFPGAPRRPPAVPPES
jgi:hypothetical protein